MALFEFDDGHLIPAHFGRSVPGEIASDILASVREQVLQIVGRALFPIFWQDAGGVGAGRDGGEPRLTALDASGQVVSIEVVEQLDSQTMIDSLSRLADTASLGWNDLAAQYPSGMPGFRAGWTEFRDAMPPSPAPGPRLILVAGKISDSVRPALDVLASSGVEVHEISVREMSNGRKFIDVEAVGPRLYGHNPNLLLRSTPQSLELERKNNETDSVEEAEGATGRHSADPRSFDPWEEGTSQEVASSEATRESVEPEVEAGPAPVEPEVKSAHGTAEAEIAPEPAFKAESAQVSQVEPQPSAQEVPQLQPDVDGLEVIAGILGQDTALVCQSENGLHTATLAPSGLISSLGWSTKDPNEAAAMVSGYSRFDGWQNWRLGDALGPTLAESLEEINREIRDEYLHLGKPRRGRRRRG
ncbi:hypothetical protein [Actinomyces sp. S4-C9]|uniref:hypothetical protein n=1 Tax=Actinomyces sp. S4-C9 TaxID=1219581 RepID=UPI000689A0A1|nr:hypothetical protein [Actinomyces sp. S4-C9]